MSVITERQKGVTLIELVITLAFLTILILGAILSYQKQLAKGRDAKRKADLNRLQKVLEDYLNDNVCYPNNLSCAGGFSPYLSSIPCDPLNNFSYKYFYSYDLGTTCKKWYKIYAKLENTDDPIIKKLGCSEGCGPSENYNYWVSSPNMAEVAQQLPGEAWWPTIAATIPSPVPTLTPTIVVLPTLTPAPTGVPSPTPTTAGPLPTPTVWYACEYSGACNIGYTLGLACGQLCPPRTPQLLCTMTDSGPLCCYTPACPGP